jgi:23S rRNA (uracil1939-C5)-methyltransferase
MDKKTLQLTIDHLSSKGHGIAQHHSKTIEVIGALPDEHVRINVHKRRRKQTAQIEELLSCSLKRISLRCAHAPACGGCTLQHLSYAEQLKEKEALIHRYFAPYLSTAKVYPIIPCQDPWRYRNKMEFSFSQDKAGNHYLGLIIAASKGRVANLKECHLSPTWFTEALIAVRAWWEGSGLLAYHPPSDRGSLRTLTLREGKRTDDKMAILTVSGNPDFALTARDLESFKQTLLPLFPNLSLFLRIQQLCKGAPTQFYEVVLSGEDHIKEILYINGRSLTFKISPSSFFQPNSSQAEILYSTALNMIQASGHALDLYSGTSTLSCILSLKAQRVTAVELNPYAVFDARVNQENNQIANLEIIQSDVKDFLKTLSSAPDLIVLDPPRTGLDPAARQSLLELSPATLLYISCNPKTQAEDLLSFFQAGYIVKEIRPIDQFPHTMHVENIALLEKA